MLLEEESGVGALEAGLGPVDLYGVRCFVPVIVAYDESFKALNYYIIISARGCGESTGLIFL